MSHYCMHRVVKVAGNFTEWFRKRIPYTQDGCSRTEYKGTTAKGKVTKNSIAKAEEMVAEWPSNYTCAYADAGIVGWQVERKAVKIVAHHKKEVTLVKAYKSKPKTILKGGTLKEVHVYAIAYDAREYDKYEHGGIPEGYDDMDCFDYRD